MSTTAFATNVSGDIRGDNKTPEERLIDAQNSTTLTSKQKQIIERNYNINYGKKNLLRASTPDADCVCFLDMTQYEQINNKYCGPATIYQTLKCINGTSPSQKKIGKVVYNTDNEITYDTSLTNYLNDNQTQYGYSIIDIRTENELKDALRYCIKINDTPAVIVMRLNKNAGWLYNVSTNHYINCQGMSSDEGLHCHLVDPFSTRVGYSGYYSEPLNVVYDAVRNGYQVSEIIA